MKYDSEIKFDIVRVQCILRCNNNNNTYISRKKYNVQGDIETLLGRDCEMEKVMG